MIGVVGGGLTGLALGYHLTRAGTPCTVFEAGAEPGGVMRSIEVEGRLLELGPQRARLTRSFRRLVEELALEDQLLRVPEGLPLYVYSRGRLRRAPLGARAFLSTDLLSPGEKLRMLLEPLTAAARPGEDVASFLSRKFGTAAYRRFLGPLYGGLYASDPARMDVELSLGRALDEMGVGRSLLLSALRSIKGARAVAACSFIDGLQTLPHALGAALGDRLRTACPVHAVKTGPGGRGWLLATDDGELPMDRVVLTVPAPEAARLLSGPAPEASARVAGLTYNPLAVVHLVADGTEPKAELAGFGYQVALDEDMETRGVTWNHAVFPQDPRRRGVVTAYLGGMGRAELLESADDRLGEVAAREFQEATGVAVRPLGVHRTRVPAWDRSWSALEGLSLPSALHLEGAYTARPGIPGRLDRANRLASQLADTRRPAV